MSYRPDGGTIYGELVKRLTHMPFTHTYMGSNPILVTIKFRGVVMNSKLKGNIALGQCIRFATENGFVISLPLTDAQDYDCIIDTGELLKVQVKYTSTKSDSGYYIVDTRVRGHINAQGEYYVKENVSPVDYYFVTTEDNINYFIPYSVIEGKQSFTLNDNYKEYMVC